jgi:SAM-dependent methyltransferase
MPLVTIDDFRDLLACPRCGRTLTGSPVSLVCDYESCGHQYPAVGSPPKPVLIDSEESIIDVSRILETDGSSPVDRDQGGRIRRFVMRRFAHPRNIAAERYVGQLASDLVAETVGRPRVLVIGGGAIGNGVESLYEDSRLDLLAFDIYASENVQFLADGHQLPLNDGTVDGVVIQAVLEHVLDPQAVVDEIRRVLRPGGLVFASTPFMQQVHEGPYDFTRFTESGHRYLFRHFTVRNSGATAGLGTQLLWSIVYFSRGIDFRAGQLARVLFFWLPKLDRWLNPRVTIDGASGVFLYGHASTKVVTPAEIVSYYSGAQG